MNTYHLKLDLNKGPKYAVPSYGGVTIRQGDKNGTTIEAEIYDHGTRLATAGLTAYLVIPLPDHEHYYRKQGTYSTGTATITIDETQAASVPGYTDNAYIELLQGSTVVASTQSFRVTVLRDALADAEVGEDYDSAIQDAIDNLNETVENIADTVEDVLDDHPEWTTTVQDGSVSDAKLIQQGGILSRVDRLMYRLDNLLTATPAEAESVTVTDAAKTPVAGLALYGKSTQDGMPTPSAPVPIQSVTPNLYHQTRYAAGDVHSTGGITVTHNADGTVTANGTATSNAWLWGGSASTDERYFVTLPAGTYVVCGSHSVAVQKKVDDTATTIVPMTRKNATFTQTEPTLIKAVPVIPSGATVDNETAWVAVYAGTRAYPYVPYGHAGLWSLGANLNPFFLVKPVEAATGYWSGSASSWTTPYDDGWAHYSRSVESQSDTDIAIMPQSMFEVGKSYTLMVEWRNVTITGTASMYMSAGSGRQMSGSGSTSITAGSGVAYKSMTCLYASDDPSVDRFFHWRTRLLANSSLDGDFRLSIYEGDYAGPYQPYESTAIPIPLDGNTLRSLPDGTRDEVTVDELGHVTLTQRVGAITFDGTETWTMSGTYTDVFSTTAVSSTIVHGLPNSGVNPILCDHGPAQSVNSIQSGSNGAAIAYSGAIYVRLGTFGSASALKTWLETNAVTIQYPLATPVVTNLGTIGPTALAGPITTDMPIPGTTMQLTYERDLNATLARLEAAIATLA